MAHTGRHDRPQVTFVYPPWISHDYNYRGTLQNTLPPLGILSIAAYLEERGYRVKVIDIHVEGLSEAEFLQRLQADPPDVVGLSVLTPMAVPTWRIARLVKQHFPDCQVICGGVHAEIQTREMLRCGAVDAVVRGDGEEATLEIVEGRPYSEILGLSYRLGSRLVHNPPRPVEMDLDQYPFPAYHLVPMDKYFPAIGTYKNLPAINMLMARGCPGKCTFCNSANTTLRTRSATRVVEEIIYLNRQFGIRQVQFYDDTFTVMRKNVEDFCRLMIERKVPVTWSAYARADCFNDSLAGLMKAAGCHQVLIGVETGDERIARNIGKPIAHQRTLETVRIAHAHGLDVRASFIIGNVGETQETLERSLEFALELDADLVQWSVNTPYPGTELFEWAKQRGVLKTEEWSEYDLSRLLIELDHLTEEDIFEFERRAMRACYLRPKAIWRRLRRITRWRQVRDLIFGFGVLILGIKHHRAATEMGQWAKGRKGEYFDLELEEELAVLPLTYQVRQETQPAVPVTVAE